MQGSNIAKPKALVPTDLCNYIAIATEDCNQHGEFVQFVKAQLMDPVTGLARGDTPPGISGPTEGDGEWTNTQAECGPYAQRCEVNNEHMDWALGAVGNGKGCTNGKGKRK